MKKDWARRRELWRRRWAGRAVLGVASFFYGLAMAARRRAYEAGWLKSRRLPAKVVCIGNLTTGGTGKTPAVLLAAHTLRRRNLPVAILTRGYGRAVSAERVVTLLDDEPPDWTECGDEPWMMHHSLLGQSIPILVCADRAKAGDQAVTYYHSKIIILDDGFQHLKLKRDLDIVLVNATDPFGGGAVLPLGNLREPLSALSRAGMIVLTHADAVEGERLEAVKERLRAYNADAPILEAAHKPDFLLDPRTGQRHKLSHLDGKKAVSFCGLADPSSFEDLLGRIGIETTQRWRYPDHYPYRPADIASINRVAAGLPIVTTLKDMTRLPKNWRELVQGDLYVLAIKLEILKGRNVWTDKLLSLAGEQAAERA